MALKRLEKGGRTMAPTERDWLVKRKIQERIIYYKPRKKSSPPDKGLIQNVTHY